MSLKDQLSEQILALDDVELRKSRFSGEEAFFVGRREIAHFHEGNELDLRLTRPAISARRGDLKANPLVTLRPSGGDWIEVRFRRKVDLEWVIELVRAARDGNASAR